MLAPVAIQQAKHLAKNFKLLLSGKSLVPFVYKDKGVMATIGRKRAVVDLPKWKFQGLFAWFVWMFVHIMSLIGFRNKLRTLIDWSGSYFNYEKPLGIIIPEFKKVD
jgi:NADH dehydrogenase